MQFKFSGKQEVYLEIAERYENYIRSGIYRDGEKLPSVRVAAGELGVNPNTVARAYALLEERGFIKALPKKGAFVCFVEKHESSASSETPAKATPAKATPAKASEFYDCRNIIYMLKERGIGYEELITQIKEVYEKQ